MEQTTKNALCLLGILCFSVGFGFHLIIPSQFRSSSNTLNPHGVFIEKIHLERNSFNLPYTLYFQFSLTPGKLTNYSLFLVNETEYLRYLNGVPLQKLLATKTWNYTNEPESNYVVIEENCQIYIKTAYYLILSNPTDTEFRIFYYTALYSRFYDYGIYIMGYGICIIMIALIMTETGWKKYLYSGIAANLVFFYIRMALLGRSWGLIALFGDTANIEFYNDFQIIYIDHVAKFLQGANNYTDSSNPYIYMPLYIWTLGIFGLFGLTWMIALPLFLFNMATGYYIFKIMHYLTQDEKKSSITIIIYYFNPFVLIYGSYIWMNPPPFVFFIVLSFYLALQNKDKYAMIAIGLAVCYKQYAVFFFPLILLFLIKNQTYTKFQAKFKKMFEYTIYFVLPVLIVSIPYLILDANIYLQRVLFGNVGQSFFNLTIFLKISNWPVTFTQFLFWMYVPLSIIMIFAYFLQYSMLFSALVLIIYIRYNQSAPSKSIKNNIELSRKYLLIRALFCAFLITCCLQLFYARGSYKFYLILLAPFMACMFDPYFLMQTVPSGEKFKFQLYYLVPLIFSWLIFFFDRYLYFALLILWIIVLIIQIIPVKKHKN